MSRIFSFALGYLTKRIDYLENNDFWNFLRGAGISGVEITLPSKEKVHSIYFSPRVLDELKNFNYVTIHAPFHLVEESENEAEIIGQLDIIHRLYLQIGAKNIIIHADNLPEKAILDRYDFKVLAENLEKQKNFGVAALENIFEKYPEVGFCLDVSHAFSWSEFETANLVKSFAGKLRQVHLSTSFRGKEHQSLMDADKDFLDSISPLKGLEIPIVIEERFEKIDRNKMENEIKYIESLFEIKT